MSSRLPQDPRARQIKIQTGVVKRIIKEKSMYEQEVVQTEKRIEKMKSDGKDEYDIRKMNEVLDESKMMVPETLERLRKSHEDLKNTLEDAEDDMKTLADYKEGVNQLEESRKMLASA